MREIGSKGFGFPFIIIFGLWVRDYGLCLRGFVTWRNSGLSGSSSGNILWVWDGFGLSKRGGFRLRDGNGIRLSIFWYGLKRIGLRVRAGLGCIK